MSPNSQSTTTITQNGYKKTSGAKTHTKLLTLQEKKFQIRNSLLTDLFENVPHIAAVQHLFAATVICLFMSVMINDYLQTGEVTLGIYLIKDAFGKLHIGAMIWICYNLATVLVFYIFQLWATVRLKLIPNQGYIKIWDRSWLIILALFYVFAFRAASVLVDYFYFPHATAAIILLEQIRLVMKIHAFVRHNAKKFINYKPHSDQELRWPNIKHFLYFLFAPTLVYRDEYPRLSGKINWDFVITRTAEVFGVILYQSFIVHRFFLPPYRDFGLRKFSWIEVLAPVVAENSIPGLLFLLSGFYVLLHSSQNIFAELLKFGDREFYKDWWTSTSYSEYFRNWNIVVHDWLHNYIYRDIYQLTKGNKALAKFAVFCASLIVHEWVMTHMFGFFYPVMLISFGSAAILSLIRFPKFRFLNVLFWYSLALGSSIICSMYTLEYYARLNQPDKGVGSYKDYIFPRWYLCDCIN